MVVWDGVLVLVLVVGSVYWMADMVEGGESSSVQLDDWWEVC